MIYVRPLGDYAKTIFQSSTPASTDSPVSAKSKSGTGTTRSTNSKLAESAAEVDSMDSTIKKEGLDELRRAGTGTIKQQAQNSDLS